MLPPRCSQPPCRNIEVTRVSSAGTIARLGGNARSPVTTAGMAPKAHDHPIPRRAETELPKEGENASADQRHRNEGEANIAED